MLPAPAAQVADDLLARLDRALPGHIEGFYVVGSACMGAFLEGRSDVDFVALVKGELSRADLARLGAVHAGRWASALFRDAGLRRPGHSLQTGSTCVRVPWRSRPST